MRMEENKNRKARKGVGRKSKSDPAVYRYGIKFNSRENAQFELSFQKSGMAYRARFIKSVLLNKEIKVVRIDKALLRPSYQFLPSVPGRRQQLQPGGKGNQDQFRGETGIRPASQSGKGDHRSGGAEQADHHANP